MSVSQNLLDALQRANEEDVIVRHEGEELIKVHHMTSAVASIYEKLRTFIDYKEEHLLRKNAVFRILKRRFIVEGDHFQKMAEHLVKELIGAKYIENETIPESMVAEVASIISKYNYLFDQVKAIHGFRDASGLYGWIMGLAACEIEKVLVPSHKETAFVRFLFNEFKHRLDIGDDTLEDKDKDLQLYIAANRCFIKSDIQMLDFLVLTLFYPHWNSGMDEKTLSKCAEDIYDIRKEIDEVIKNKLGNKIIKHGQNIATMVSILREVLYDDFGNAQSLLSDSDALSESIKAVCQKKYRETRKRLSRSAFRSIIYILITKVTIALLIEVPFDYYMTGSIQYLGVGVNISFPPLLMLVIALSTRAPSDKNTQAMIAGIQQILRGEVGEVMYIKKAKVRRFVTSVIFNIIYFFVFLIPFVAIVWVLASLEFTALSIVLFLMFMSIVSFFGVRIRTTARELVVLTKKENFITELFDFLTLPIIRFGRWISLNFSKINIFVFILDFIIEAPLKLVLGVFEEWMNFLREKKEEMN